MDLAITTREPPKDRRKFAFYAWLALKCLLTLLLVGTIVIGTPHVDDVHGVGERIATFDQHRYLLIDGEKEDGLEQMCVIRAYSVSSRNIQVDAVGAWFFPFMPWGIGNGYPICIDLRHLWPGNWTVSAQENGKYVHVFSFRVEPDARRRS